jgi:ribosomal protein L24E
VFPYAKNSMFCGVIYPGTGFYAVSSGFQVYVVAGHGRESWKSPCVTPQNNA